MKVHVDLDECEANAICVGIQPAVFHLDDDDVLHILVDEVPAGMEDDARQAVNRCPKRALFITDD